MYEQDFDETKFKTYIPSLSSQELGLSEQDKDIWLQFERLENLVHDLQLVISKPTTFTFSILPFSALSTTFPFSIPYFPAASTSVIFHTPISLVPTATTSTPFSFAFQIHNIVFASTSFQVTMDTRYAPLALLGELHDLPQNYGQQLVHFDGPGGFTAQQHLDKFN